MPNKITSNKNINKKPRLATKVKQHNNNNFMKKDLVFPLVAGIIFGAMIMMFWQFTVRLNNQSLRLAQLEEFASQNSQTVNEVVSFINQNLAPQGQAPTGGGAELSE